eukprot:2405916-Karenia_brevis.AAC.1
MQVHNGQFGQRVHLDPRSEEGKAHLSNPEDGWLNSCTSNLGWGVPITGKGWGRPRHVFSAEYDSRGQPSSRAADGNIVADWQMKHEGAGKRARAPASSLNPNSMKGRRRGPPSRQ